MRRVQLISALAPALALVAGAALAASHPSASSAHQFVSAATARRAALRSVPGRALTSKLENEDGKMQYSVMVKRGASMYEVMIDAKTGRFASKEKVTAAEEAQEARSEAKEAHLLRHVGHTAHRSHASAKP